MSEIRVKEGSQDMTGVEVCGAMKNVIAIVCGISAGSGAGDNTLALIKIGRAHV